VTRRLAARGHDVRVIAARTDADLPDEEVVDGVRLRHVRTAPKGIIHYQRVGFYASRLPWYMLAGRAAPRWLAPWPADAAVEARSPVGGRAVARALRPFGVPWIQDVHSLLGETSAWLRMYGPIGLWGATYERWLTTGRVELSSLVSDSSPLLERMAKRRPDLP